MSIHNFPSEIKSHLLDMLGGPGSATENKMLQAKGLGYLWGFGQTVPADADTGWAAGAIYQHTNETTGLSTTYENVGDTSSCNFDLFTADLSGTGGAALVGILDSGGFTAATEVEAALAEIYQHIASAQAYIPLPLISFIEIDGTALADFGGDSTTPGFHGGAETSGIRWHNQASPDPIQCQVVIPPDLDAGSDVIVHLMVSATGTATVTTTFDIIAFNNPAAALYDADADFGGVSSAMATTHIDKHVTELTRTLAAASVAAAPCMLSLTLQPTDGTITTDDIILHGVWLEYTRKILTS